MFNFLRKKIVGDRFGKLHDSLNLTFSNVKQDINTLKQWISHLNEKSKAIDLYKETLTLTREDVKNLNLWIEYLERRHNELHSYVLDLHQNDKELFERLKNLEEIKEKIVKIEENIAQGQTGTLQGTNKGQTRDTSIEESPKEMKVKAPVKLSILDKEEFAGAELEVLNVLYHSDRPLSHENIAKIVGKKEKSIRNIICEIRRKGIEVLDKPIGIKQKGFYLPAEEKIKVSGR